MTVFIWDFYTGRILIENGGLKNTFLRDAKYISEEAQKACLIKEHSVVAYVMHQLFKVAE